MLTAILLFSALSARAQIRIVGSDLLGGEFTRALLEFGVRADVPLRVNFDGSLRGRAQLEAGKADIALLFFAPDDPSLPAAFQAVPLAHQVVTVIVQADSPLTHLTLDQLAGAFGLDAPVTVQHWGHLGLPLAWTGQPVLAHVLAPGAGLLHDFFRQAAMRGHGYKTNVTRHPGAADVVRQVAAEPNGIGLVPLPPDAAAKVRVVPVALNAQSIPVAPSPESVQSGDYPLRLPCQLVVRKNAAKALLPVLRFLLGDEAAKQLEAGGFMPLPEAARGLQLLALERL